MLLPSYLYSYKQWTRMRICSHTSWCSLWDKALDLGTKGTNAFFPLCTSQFLIILFANYAETKYYLTLTTWILLIWTVNVKMSFRKWQNVWNLESLVLSLSSNCYITVSNAILYLYSCYPKRAMHMNFELGTTPSLTHLAHSPYLFLVQTVWLCVKWGRSNSG